VNGERLTVNGEWTPASHATRRESKGSVGLPFTVNCSLFTGISRSLITGFTLIELLVVMAIIATLLTLAVPRYFHSTDRAKEAVLKQNLAQMRESIDKYYGDRGRYPDSLDDLVSRKYLRKIPPDPITDSPLTWVTVPPDLTGSGSVFDVRSGAPGTALDGSSYDKW
jgi:general secretion pathway protein G